MRYLLLLLFFNISLLSFSQNDFLADLINESLNITDKQDKEIIKTICSYDYNTISEVYTIINNATSADDASKVLQQVKDLNNAKALDFLKYITQYDQDKINKVLDTFISLSNCKNLWDVSDVAMNLIDQVNIKTGKELLPKIIQDSKDSYFDNLMFFDFKHFCDNDFNYCAYNPYQQTVYMMWIDEGKSYYTAILLNENCVKCEELLKQKKIGYKKISDWKAEWSLNLLKVSALNNYLASLVVNTKYQEWLKTH